MASDHSANGEPPGPFLVVRIGEPLRSQLAQAAGENQRSQAQEVRYALGLYLRNVDKRRQQVAAS